MNSKHFRVRQEPNTGKIWLVIEKPHEPIKRVKDITSDVILALAADVLVEGNTQSASRDIQFSDGGKIRLTVEDLTNSGDTNEREAPTGNADSEPQSGTT